MVLRGKLFNVWKCLILFGVFGIVIFYYTNPLKKYSKMESFRSTNSTKYILYWTLIWNDRNFHFPQNGSELFRNCLFKNCYATSDRTLLPVEQYDAILFYVPTSREHEREVIPAKRSPHQRYVFGNAETPVHFFGSAMHYAFNNFYNWTMTYRFDSDIVRRYGVVEKEKTDYVMPSADFVRAKNRSIAWFVSNCRSAVSRRWELAQKLSKYIEVDIYGKCGNLTCDDRQKCYNMLEKNYRFYLSFENSYCKDYTTEKLYRILPRNVIPVVYGGGDYKTCAPPHSVINVEDFETVEDLANYLKDLENDAERYLQYFEWKKDYHIANSNLLAACTLCQKLNDPLEPPKTYENIHDWWFGKRKSGCKTGNELPEIVF